jgi:uncharacterized coiled-coil DUF342 family protein
MFSNFSDLTSFASKLSAEFSLDNLQTEDEKPQTTNSGDTNVESVPAPVESPPREVTPAKQTPSLKEATPVQKTSGTPPSRNVSSGKKIAASPQDDIWDIMEQEEAKGGNGAEYKSIIADLEEKLSSEIALSQKKSEDMKELRRQLRDEKRSAKELREKLNSMDSVVSEYETSKSSLSSRNAVLEKEVDELREMLSRSVASSESTVSVDSAACNSTCNTCNDFKARVDSLKQAYDNLEKKYEAERKRTADQAGAQQEIAASYMFSLHQTHQEELQSMNDKLSASQQEAISLKQEIQQLKEELAVSQSAATNALSSAKQLEQTLAQRTAQLSSKEAEVSRLSEELHASQTSLAELKEKQVSLTAKMKDKIKQMMDAQGALEKQKAVLAEALRNKVCTESPTSNL